MRLKEMRKQASTRETGSYNLCCRRIMTDLKEPYL